MSADEWIAPVPGSEGLLALAMAQVIVTGRRSPLPADAARLRGLLAAHAPEKVAAAVGIAASEITRLAREFAASQGGLAVAGGVAAQYPNGAEIVAAVDILNYVAGPGGKNGQVRPQHGLGQAGSVKQLRDPVPEP